MMREAFRTVERAGRGRYPRRPGPLARPRDAATVRNLPGKGGVIARGNPPMPCSVVP